jgi:hypothetical protein
MIDKRNRPKLYRSCPPKLCWNCPHEPTRKPTPAQNDEPTKHHLNRRGITRSSQERRSHKEMNWGPLNRNRRTPDEPYRCRHQHETIPVSNQPAESPKSNALHWNCCNRTAQAPCRPIPIPPPQASTSSTPLRPARNHRNCRVTSTAPHSPTHGTPYNRCSTTPKPA